MKILIAGDLLPFDRVVKLFDQKQYDKVFGQIKQTITSADYSIVNFECPVCKDGEKAIEKLGPSHKCSNSVIGAIQFAGFKCVTLANNHFRDFGDDGCQNTLKELDENHIDHVGGGMNSKEAARVLYVEVAGERLAVINCCEHEFSIVSDTTAGSHPLNPIEQYYAIQEARKNADYVVVIVHGGPEHYQLPSPRMVETYRFFIDAGADAVVNHHQHCYSGYEVYKGKPIFYGLGNFCFDKPIKRNDIWNEGYMVQLELNLAGLKYTIIPYNQCNDEPVIVPLAGEAEKAFNEKLSELNAIIGDDQALKDYFDKWCTSKHKSCESVLVPYTNMFLRKLWMKGVLPSFLPKERIIGLYNVTRCESHYDAYIHYLEKKQWNQ